MRNRETLWMGTQESYDHYVSVLAQVEKGLIARKMPDDDDEEDDDVRRHRYDTYGKLAVIPVKGSLVSNGPEWMVDFGVTPYSFVRNALIEAANDRAVEMILLDVDSSGGSANGVFDIGNLVRKVSTVKPVAAHTGGMMCSAAYLIGSSATEVACGPAAEVGSIGVIVTHMNYSEALKKDGVEATVLRAGKYKALASPFEPLSKAAEAQIQGQLDKLYGLFVDHVALMRNRPTAVVKHDMAEGRVFIGDDALQAGLVDKLASFDDFAGELILRARKRSDDKSTMNMEVDVARKEVLLNEEQVAAIAEGADVAAVLDAKPEAPVVPEVPVVEELKAEAPLVIEEPKVEEPKADALVSYLQAELKNKGEEIVQLCAAKLDMERKLAAFEATHGELKALAAASVNRMRIALGGSSMDLSGLPAETILAEHAKASESFSKTFPIGGKAVVQVETDTPRTEAVASTVSKSKRRAVSI